MPYSGPGEVAFSPDGKTVAFTWFDAIYVGTPLIEDVAAGVMPETCYGQWSPAGTTAFPSGIRVEGAAITIGDRNIQEYSYAPRFSLDSRYLAFATESRIIVVQPGSSDCVARIEPSEKNGKIAGLTWSAAGELVYAVSLPKGEWVFWKRDLSAENANLRQICRLMVSTTPLQDAGLAKIIHWSPSGRWAVVNVQTSRKASSEPKSGDIAYHAILLDLETGKYKELAGSNAMASVVWKDDTEALCQQCDDKAPDGFVKQYVLHVPSGELTPLPLKAAEVSRKSTQAMGFSFHTTWSPLPSRQGWLVAFDPESHDIYAVNLATKAKVKLNNMPTLAYAISSDGRKLAHVNAFKKLTVQDIVLADNP